MVDGGNGPRGIEDGKLLLSLAMVPGRQLYRRRGQAPGRFLAKEDESAGQSNSNAYALIFFFPLSHYKGKSPFSISTYMEEVFEQIDFLSFLYGKGDAMSSLSIGDWREIIGD